DPGRQPRDHGGQIGDQPWISELLSRDWTRPATLLLSLMRVLIALLAVAAVGAVGWSLRLSRRLRHSERDRRRSADELNRRLSALFSLQELSYILSGSLQLDRIVEQVVRYAMRFLEAKGALVALAADGEGPEGAGHRPLTVSAAEGTLGHLRGRTIGADDAGLIARSLTGERVELVDR